MLQSHTKTEFTKLWSSCISMQNSNKKQEKNKNKKALLDQAQALNVCTVYETQIDACRYMRAIERQRQVIADSIIKEQAANLKPPALIVERYITCGEGHPTEVNAFNLDNWHHTLVCCLQVVSCQCLMSCNNTTVAADIVSF